MRAGTSVTMLLGNMCSTADAWNAAPPACCCAQRKTLHGDCPCFFCKPRSLVYGALAPTLHRIVDAEATGFECYGAALKLGSAVTS